MCKVTVSLRDTQILKGENMTGRKDDEKRQQDYITKKLFERHHGATKSLILKPLNHKVVDRGIEPLCQD